jgi:hypothetical protein
MPDERICGQRNGDGIICQLLPDHPAAMHAGLDANFHIAMWPRQSDYQPQHQIKVAGDD